VAPEVARPDWIQARLQAPFGSSGWPPLMPPNAEPGRPPDRGRWWPSPASGPPQNATRAALRSRPREFHTVPPARARQLRAGRPARHRPDCGTGNAGSRYAGNDSARAASRHLVLPPALEPDDASGPAHG